MATNAPGVLRPAIKIMAGAEGEARDQVEATASSVAEVAGAGGQPIDPAVALTATIRFALWVSESEFRLGLAAPLAAWAALTWGSIVKNHRFRLRDPQVTSDAIAAALDGGAPPLAFVAGLALAAMPATHVHISRQVRSALAVMAGVA